MYMFNIVYNYFYINEFNELNSQSFIESIKHPASNPKEIEHTCAIFTIQLYRIMSFNLTIAHRSEKPCFAISHSF